MNAASDLRPGPDRPRVVVTVGTDHHPFNRIIGWVNDWLAAHPDQVADFFVQSGSASAVPACRAKQSLDSDELEAVLDSADVIVAHGGPATIAAAWARGVRPIVVPRLPGLGEHVDDHQVTFCRKLAELGRISLAQTSAEFSHCLAAARDCAGERTRVPAADVDAAVSRFGELVDQLVGRPRPRRTLWQRGRAVSHRPASGLVAAAVNTPPEPSTRWNAQIGHVRADAHEMRNAEQE